MVFKWFRSELITWGVWAVSTYNPESLVTPLCTFFLASDRGSLASYLQKVFCNHQNTSSKISLSTCKQYEFAPNCGINLRKI